MELQTAVKTGATLVILYVSLFWTQLPLGASIAIANGLAESSDCMDDTWEATSTVGAPGARSHHTAVWTGSEMIVWGAGNTGGRYDPTTDTWRAIATDGAPSAREFHTAVWTGSQMIVWGGQSGFPRVVTNTGGQYDPATDTWTATSTEGAPSPRSAHTAVWTGSEMIVWGGEGPGPYLNSGGRYDPATDTWSLISTDGAPSGRIDHTAVWTGSEMIVWGGYFVTSTGGRYDPVTDTWRAISTDGAPSAQWGHTAVWTGSEMMVWAGIYYDGSYHYLSTGGRYDPATDTWTATSLANAPNGRGFHAAVWTGSEMIVWGGGYSDGIQIIYLDSGVRYDPTTDTWASTSLANAPNSREFHTGVWTGTEL